MWSFNRMWEISFFKNHAEIEARGLILDLFLPLKNITIDKSQWLKLQVSRSETPLKRDFSTGTFV